MTEQKPAEIYGNNFRREKVQPQAHRGSMVPDNVQFDYWSEESFEEKCSVNEVSRWCFTIAEGRECCFDEISRENYFCTHG